MPVLHWPWPRSAYGNNSAGPSQTIWLSTLRRDRPEKSRNAQATEISKESKGGCSPSLVDDGAGEIEEHDPRNDREESGACAGTPLSASSFRSARQTRPRLQPVANGAVRSRLLLAFARQMRQSQNAKDERRLLDEKTRTQCASRSAGNKTAPKIWMAVRGNLGMPGEGSRQTGQYPSPPFRFGAPSLTAAIGLEGRRRAPLLDHFKRAQRPPLEVEGVDRKRANSGRRVA